MLYFKSHYHCKFFSVIKKNCKQERHLTGTSFSVLLPGERNGITLPQVCDFFNNFTNYFDNLPAIVLYFFLLKTLIILYTAIQDILDLHIPPWFTRFNALYQNQLQESCHLHH